MKCLKWLQISGKVINLGHALTFTGWIKPAELSRNGKVCRRWKPFAFSAYIPSECWFFYKLYWKCLFWIKVSVSFLGLKWEQVLQKSLSWQHDFPFLGADTSHISPWCVRVVWFVICFLMGKKGERNQTILFSRVKISVLCVVMWLPLTSTVDSGLYGCCLASWLTLGEQF